MQTRVNSKVPVTELSRGVVLLPLRLVRHDHDVGSHDPGHSGSDGQELGSAPDGSDDAGGPPEGWEDNFTAEQLRTCEAALVRWERFNSLANEVYRAGQDTPEARSMLREYSVFAQRDIVTLAEQYDRGGLRIESPEEPLWIYATSIEPSYVVMSQCTDYSETRVTRDGNVIDGRPENLVTPLEIRMTKPEGGDWKFEQSELRDDEPCDG